MVEGLEFRVYGRGEGGFSSLSSQASCYRYSSCSSCSRESR